ncbi:MAG: GNAT family N-acetyltransferase [Alphaproteobacteria bacterium]|nr:GNAT family N-acetyltransferase [Alphaproteobacteria bacterium]
MIKTARLHIRPRTISDLDKVHSAKMDVKTDLMRWMSWASESQFKYSATEHFIRQQNEPTETYDGWLGMSLATDDFVIACGLRQTYPGVYKTGYWVAKHYLNLGYATEACRAMVMFAFEALNATSVQIDHFEGNEKSKRVIEKVGFQFTHTEPEGLFCHALQKKVSVLHYEIKKTEVTS